MIGTDSNYSVLCDYYSRHYSEVLAFVSKRMKYDDSSEDIVQNVFLKLMKMNQMITPVTLPSLVYTIARNMIMDFWRHKNYVEQYEHRIQSTSSYSSFSNNDVESVYSATEVNEILERGIARLSDRQQSIYRMNVYEGKQVKDISQELGINYKTVENRLGAARKEVRSYMKRQLA